MTSNLLCLSTDLSSTDAAAWAQAVGTILAIVGTAAIARWQMKRQFEISERVENDNRNAERLDSARTAAELGKKAWQMAGFLRSAFRDDRSIVMQMARKDLPFDLNGLRYIEDQLASVPLHTVPHEIMQELILLTNTIRQMREKIEQVFRVYESMDAAAYADYFSTLREMVDSMKRTTEELAAKVQEMSAVRAAS